MLFQCKPSNIFGIFCLLFLFSFTPNNALSTPPKARSFEQIWQEYVWATQKHLLPEWKSTDPLWYQKRQGAFFNILAAKAEKYLAPHQKELEQHIQTILSKLPKLPEKIETSYTEEVIPEKALSFLLKQIGSLSIMMAPKTKHIRGLFLAMRFFNPIVVASHLHNLLVSRQISTSMMGKRSMIKNMLPSRVYLRSSSKDRKTVTIVFLSYFEYFEMTLTHQKKGYYLPTHAIWRARP